MSDARFRIRLTRSAVIDGKRALAGTQLLVAADLAGSMVRGGGAVLVDHADLGRLAALCRLKTAAQMSSTSGPHCEGTA